MAIAKLDFNRGQVVNPLAAMGDDITKTGQLFRQQELDALAAQRAQAADQRAQQQLQMQLDERNERLKAKEAANAYMQNLSGATSAGVGVQDQATLGSRIAEMGKQAEAAYAAGNKGLGDEIVASQQSYLQKALPAMNKAFEASPQAKLDLMSTMTAGREDLTKAMDPQTRVAMYKEASQPFEKLIDREAVAQDRRELAELENKYRMGQLGVENQYRLGQLEQQLKGQKELRGEEAALVDKTWNVDGTLVTGSRKDMEDYQKRNPDAKISLSMKPIYDKETYVMPDGSTVKLLAGQPIPKGAVPSDSYYKRREQELKLAGDVDKAVAASGNPAKTGQAVAEMRSKGMSERAISTALAAATGGEVYDMGKPDYNVDILKNALSNYTSTGAVDTQTPTATTTQPQVSLVDTLARYNTLKDKVEKGEATPAEEEALPEAKRLVELLQRGTVETESKLLEKARNTPRNKLTPEQKDALSRELYRQSGDPFLQ